MGKGGKRRRQSRTEARETRNTMARSCYLPDGLDPRNSAVALSPGERAPMCRDRASIGPRLVTK